MNQRPVAQKKKCVPVSAPQWKPEEFPERSPVLAQLGFQMCSGLCHLQRSVPDEYGCTRAHQTLLKEEVNQRPVA